MPQVEEARLVLLISTLLRLIMCRLIIYSEGDPEAPPVTALGHPLEVEVPFTSRKAEALHRDPKG